MNPSSNSTIPIYGSWIEAVLGGCPRWSAKRTRAFRIIPMIPKKSSRVERPLTESRQSQQDWRSILRNFVAVTAPADYRWTPPNRRYIASGHPLQES